MGTTYDYLVDLNVKIDNQDTAEMNINDDVEASYDVND